MIEPPPRRPENDASSLWSSSRTRTHPTMKMSCFVKVLGEVRQRTFKFGGGEFRPCSLAPPPAPRGRRRVRLFAAESSLAASGWSLPQLVARLPCLPGGGVSAAAGRRQTGRPEGKQEVDEDEKRRRTTEDLHVLVLDGELLGDLREPCGPRLELANEKTKR